MFVNQGDYALSFKLIEPTLPKASSFQLQQNIVLGNLLIVLPQFEPMLLYPVRGGSRKI